MTEQDRELLELAAKAAWCEIDGWDAWGFAQTKEQERWNPLVDDGDALRLAVRIGIEEIFVVTISGVHQSTVACDASVADGAEESFIGDPYAATRRAIVRAAAEIGRSMA